MEEVVMTRTPWWWLLCMVLCLGLSACIAEDLETGGGNSEGPVAPENTPGFASGDDDLTPKVLNGEPTLERTEIGGIYVGN